MKVLVKILAIMDGINEGAGSIFKFLVIALMLFVSYDVIMRYVFSRPTEWGQEVNGYLQLGVVFLGGGYALLRNAHVRVDNIYKKLPLRGKAVVDVLAYLVLFAICAVLIWKGGEVAWGSFRKGTLSPSTWGPPMWVSQALIPIGGVLIGIAGLGKWIRSLYMLATGAEPGKRESAI
jgi:TRAP-type mannitol/chloroaromatic compound transport system permease small subunit